MDLVEVGLAVALAGIIISAGAYCFRSPETVTGHGNVRLGNADLYIGKHVLTATMTPFTAASEVERGRAQDEAAG